MTETACLSRVAALVSRLLIGGSRAGARALAVVVLLTSVGAANAQESGDSADVAIRMGLQTLQLMDQGKSAALWERASPVMKAVMPKEALASQAAQVVRLLGSVRKRDWSTLSRIQIPEGTPNTPAGLYLNVGYFVQGANGARLFELVTFRLESDSNWRLAGYNQRPQP